MNLGDSGCLTDYYRIIRIKSAYIHDFLLELLPHIHNTVDYRLCLEKRANFETV